MLPGIVVLLFLLFGSGLAAAGHGVILLYHHVSDQTPPSTSVAPDRFEQHLQFLEQNDYQVWPLARLLESIYEKNGKLPDNVVAITFDDAYESVYHQAWPRLAERGWPFTVFVNSDAIDQGLSPYMDWSQLRELAEHDVAIENHSASHDHLLFREDGQTPAAWRQRVLADIERAQLRIKAETGHAPTMFAYPYGEDSAELAEIVSTAGYYGLTQRSGAVGQGTDPQAIPRFPMATGLDSLDRLELAVRSRPLPVISSHTEPAPTQGTIDELQTLELVLAPSPYRLESLACYSGDGKQLDLEVDRGDLLRLKVEVAGIGKPGRNRVNCTAPAADESGDFYWYAFQWVQLGPGSGRSID
ncbi:MAG: polysaccharide deacetylase family protein [Wenzhouxiangellaceae bacterium]|nr:polysaccharide deacetylase family protein [Wenzhouxiangellaceae bacterium]